MIGADRAEKWKWKCNNAARRDKCAVMSPRASVREANAFR